MGHTLFTTYMVLATATAATAQPVGDVTWYFTAETADGDDIIEPHLGETQIHLRLFADFDPDVDGIEGSVVGFAGSIFDIHNAGNVQTGRVVNYYANPDLYNHPPPILDENGNIRLIEIFQLPPSFNSEFQYGDPLFMFGVIWDIDGNKTPREMTYTTDRRINMDVYFTNLGASQSWTAIEGEVTWRVVPGPSTACLLLVGCGYAFNRRRSGSLARR